MLRNPPLLLLEPFAALRTLRAAGVVLAYTLQNIGVGGRVSWFAGVRMTVAHAATSNTDVFDTVEILEGGNFGVSMKRGRKCIVNPFRSDVVAYRQTKQKSGSF